MTITFELMIQVILTNPCQIFNFLLIDFIREYFGQLSRKGKACDKGKITIYQFDVENECDQIANKPCKTRKQKPTKFRMKKDHEGASLFMQFLVLFSRNFKASSRNMVSFFISQSLFKNCSNFSCSISFWFMLVSLHIYSSRRYLACCIKMLEMMLHKPLATTSICMGRFYWLCTRAKCRWCYHVSVCCL